MKIKIGFIGCGRWAQQTYLPLLQKEQDVELVAVSGVSSQKRGQELVEVFGFARFYDDWREMIDKEELSLVVITTPHAFHYEQIKLSLQHGLHVHVDKPPALHFEQVKELITLAKKNTIQVNVHTQRRFYEEYIYAKQQIMTGKLGNIHFVQGEFGQQLFDDFHGSWRSNPDLAGGGIMIDSGYHILDSILYMIGNGTTTSVVMMSNNGDHLSDAFATLSVKTTSGCVITLNVSRGLPQTTAIERVQIVGSLGWILISRSKRGEDLHLEVEHYTIDGSLVRKTTQAISLTDKAAPLRNLLCALRHKEELISNLESASECVQILEAGYKSAATSTMVFL